MKNPAERRHTIVVEKPTQRRPPAPGAVPVSPDKPRQDSGGAAAKPEREPA